MPRFTRTVPAPVVRGGYRAFRLYVREDFQETCAYCLMQEIWAAGRDGFQIDHFYPKSLFPEKIDDFYNLYWSCYPCNHNKLNYWPTPEEVALGCVYVDLCQDDFEQHFLEHADGRLIPLTAAAEYTIDRLVLNRDHLVKLRRILTQLGHPHN